MFIGIHAKSAGTTTENVFPKKLMMPLYLGWFKPNVWNELAKPCHK